MSDQKQPTILWPALGNSTMCCRGDLLGPDRTGIAGFQKLSRHLKPGQVPLLSVLAVNLDDCALRLQTRRLAMQKRPGRR